MIKIGELRDQIASNAKRNKNKIVLQKLAIISDLLRRMYDDEDYKTLSDEEWTQGTIILDVIQIQNPKHLNYIKYFINGMERTGR